MHGAKALLPITVVILGTAIARLDASFDEGLVKRVVHPVTVAGIEGSAAASIAVLPADPALRAAKVGKASGVAPALRTLRHPVVEVAGMAAHVDHAIDGGRAPKHLPSSAVDASPIEVGFGLAPVAPVVAGLPHGNGEGRGHADEEPTVVGSCFEKKHPSLRIFAEPSSQHRPCGAAADDDSVVALLGHGGLLPLCLARPR